MFSPLRGLSPPRIGTADHFNHVHPALDDFMTRGHFPHVGWEEEYLPPVTGMLTELSRCCMGTACGQMFGTGTGLGLQRWNCWSPAKSWSQNRRVLTACFTKPELNKCQSRRCLMDCPAHWLFHFRASGCVRLGGIERQCASVFVSVVLLLSHPNSRALSLAICMSERQDQI